MRTYPIDWWGPVVFLPLNLYTDHTEAGSLWRWLLLPIVVAVEIPWFFGLFPITGVLLVVSIILTLVYEN